MNFLVTFDTFQAIPLGRDPARVLIRWSLKTTKIKLSDFEFYIDRSDTPEQFPNLQNTTIDGDPLVIPVPEATTANLLQLNTNGINALDFYEYVDFTPYLKNLIQDTWYRVRCRRISTQEEIATPAFTFTGTLDLVGLYVVDEHNFKFKDTTGQPLMIRQRRRGGILCPDCFDPVQNKRTKSKCFTCFNTNWVGGFYDDTSAYGDLGTPERVTVIAEWGETQPSETDIMFTNYPILRNGDLIRGIIENRMYRVVKVKEVIKRVAPMIQFARLIEINPGDVEYSVPFNEDLAKSLRDEFDEVLRRREF